MPWTPITGRKAAAGLYWLEQTAGPRAVQKFLGGKIRGTQFSGQYLTGMADFPEGRKVICELLELLQQGHGIPLCDVDSYYAAGKRWPLGMALREGRLVDIWPPAGSLPSPVPARDRKRPCRGIMKVKA